MLEIFSFLDQMSTIVQRKPWDENKKNNSENNVDLRVIGAGLPRTGTASLKAALEILGFGPCHHMEEMFKKPNRTLEFSRAYDGEKVDFHELMKGYGSTVDTPAADFYKEIHQAYPQAKIILTVRDSNEKWFESFQNTIGPVGKSNFYYFCVYPIRFLRLQCKLGRQGLAKCMREYGEIGLSTYDKYNKRVISENNEGEILIFNVKEGWAPLCKFLEVDIPEGTPFPNVNDTNEFNRKITFAKAIGLCVWTTMGALFILSSYLVMQMR